jgi:hypothetical protein
VEKNPSITTRLAKVCRSSPEKATDVARLHETVPRTVATPVEGSTEPDRSIWTWMSSALSTVTLNVAVAVLPAVSVAVQVTVVSPIGKVLPEAGSQVTWGLGSALSVAETSKDTTAPAGSEVTVVMSPGTWSSGGIESPSPKA